MENLSMIDVNKPEKVQTALNELIAYKNSMGEVTAAVTANSIGLGNVDNTSDEDKPVSTAQKEYIDEADATLQANIDAIASDLENYYTKSETYSQEEINSKISAIPKYATEVVSELPTENISETAVYLVVSGDESNNLYTEYIYVNSSWEKLGTQALDLSGYATTAYVDELIGDVSNVLDILNGEEV